jgi:tyrosine-protein kinase Etk/Wzc
LIPSSGAKLDLLDREEARSTCRNRLKRKASVSTETQRPDDGVNAKLLPALRSLLQIALRRGKLVVIETAALILFASVVAILLPNLYIATVAIMPPQNNSPSAALSAQLGNLGALAAMGGSALGVKNPNDMQVALLKSRTTEYAMVERFQLQAEYHKRYVSSARARWEKMTTIDSGLKDGLIRLSVTDRDPQRAAELANGWVEEYRRVTANLALTEASQRRMFFEREVNEERDELERAEDNLKATEDRTGVLELDGQARALIASAALLRAQVAAKQVEIRAMREFATSENPDMARAEQELSGMEGQLAAMDVDSDHTTGDLIAPKGKVTQTGLEFARALREEKFHEAMYELLTRQYELARVDEARQGSIVQIVDPAIPPDRPGSHYRLWIFLAGLVFALPLALITAWIVELVSVALGLRKRLGGWTAVLELGWTGEAQ